MIERFMRPERPMKSLGQGTRLYDGSLRAFRIPRITYFNYEQITAGMESGAVCVGWPRAVGRISAAVQQRDNFFPADVHDQTADRQRRRPEVALRGADGRCADWHGVGHPVGAWRDERHHLFALVQPI